MQPQKEELTHWVWSTSAGSAGCISANAIACTSSAITRSLEPCQSHKECILLLSVDIVVTLEPTHFQWLKTQDRHPAQRPMQSPPFLSLQHFFFDNPVNTLQNRSKCLPTILLFLISQPVGNTRIILNPFELYSRIKILLSNITRITKNEVP